MNVIADINIICIEQIKYEIFENDSLSVVCKKNPYVFYKEWDILSALRGNWHQITPRKRDFGKYDDEFFNLFCRKNKCYISIDEGKYNKNLVYNIIEFYLKQSSINKICFLIRLNYQKKQKINGVIKYKDFIKKLENKKILFDTAYIIEL